MSGYIVQMAADAKQFVRGSFQAPIGVCLSCDDIDQFNEKYLEIISTLLNEYSITGGKSIYSSMDIGRKFGVKRREYSEFMEKFASNIGKESCIKINFIYTTLSPSALPQGIVLYTGSNSTQKIIKVPQFLDLLSQYYPYICAWIITKRARFHGRLIVIDNIQGEITNAWEELTREHTVRIYPSGDLCNSMISASDLIVKYLDQKLLESKAFLRMGEIEKIFERYDINIISHYVGHDELDDIKPREKKSINLDEYLIRPMIYILKEGIIEKETEYIKSSIKLMEVIEKYVNTYKGGLKIIDYSQDYKFIRDRDHLIYLGDKGKEQAEYLKKLKDVIITNVDDLLKLISTS